MGEHSDITVFSFNQSEYERNIICELHDPGDIFQTNENVHEFDAQRGCYQNFEFMTLWSGVLVGFFERRIGYILEVNIHEFLLGLLKGKSALLGPVLLRPKFKTAKFMTSWSSFWYSEKQLISHHMNMV